MLTKPVTCDDGCPLSRIGQGYASTDGTGRNGVLLVGEALGAQEVAKGLPFVGDAGVQLNRSIERTRLKRADFKITNIVRCQPPGNEFAGMPWEEGAAGHCRHNLDAVIGEMKPRVIVAMGAIPLKYILGLHGIMDRHAPKRGYVYDSIVSGHHCFVVPTPHPSFIMQGNTQLTGVQMMDLVRAERVAREGYREPACNYVEHPCLADADAWADEAELACGNGAWLTADIETPRSGATAEDDYGEIVDAEILRISFAFKAHHAITLVWKREFMPVVQRLLRLPTTLVWWNQDFDAPRLKAAGMTLTPKQLDAMAAWHFLQSDVPRALGFVASLQTELTEWKSLSDSRQEFYSCRDADAAIQCCYKTRDSLKREGRWDAFVGHVVELKPILDQMSRNGVLLDLKKRDTFRALLVKEKDDVTDRIQRNVPIACKRVKRYKRTPPDGYLGKPHSVGGEVGVWDCDDAGWFVRLPWNPNSSQQMLTYLRFKHYVVPKNHKTGEDTTAKGDLDKLARKHDDQVLVETVYAREYTKMIGTYIDGYEPDVDGRLRAHFDQKPSTLRLNCEKPNLQNVRKRWKLAKQYREQFMAGDGNVLVEMDYKAIEAVITGVLAGDVEYVAAAKLGIHAILASYVLGAPIDIHDVNARAKVHALKREHPQTYDDCKHVVHGSNYLATPFKMRMDFPDSFPSLKDAKQKQDLYFNTLAKKVQAWQQATLSVAYSRGYLDNAMKYRHYLWDVLHWDWRKRMLVPGQDAKKAAAFDPQSTAAGIIKMAMKRIARIPCYLAALRLQAADRTLDSRIAWLKAEMERPVPELGNLIIETEVTVGRNWGQMKDWTPVGL
jgi:uracil-DNA glycosylase family 4